MFYKLFLLILFFFSPLYALTIEDSVQKFENFQIEYLYDDQARLTIRDITQQTFNKTSNSQFTFGYLDGNTWFKIKIKNTTQQEDFVLYFTEPLWEKFDLYSYDKNGWTLSRAGLLIPLDQREITDVNPAFNLHVPKNSEKVFYVCARTVSGQIGEFEIFTKKYFFSPSRISLTDIYLLYTTILLVIFFLNSYLFIRQREPIYAYYLGYILATTVWISTVSGSYLMFGLTPWNEALHATGTFFLFFIVLFSAEFLELKQRYKNTYTIFHVFALFFLIFTLLIALKVPYASKLFNILSTLFFTLLLIMSIKVYRDGHIKMRYYLLALAFYMPAVSLMTLNFNNIIENNDVTRYAFIFGSMIEILFFNSLMINRFHLAAQEANIDSLSRLYNRRYLLTHSKQVFDEAKQFNQELCVIMIDIDNFKIINDTHGHIMGDEVIKFCALTLSHLFRSTDLIARYGGEEFIVLTKDLQQKDVLNVAERVRQYIEKNPLYSKENNEVYVTVSIGITKVEDSDEDIDMVIHRADKALYTAKSRGKNRMETLQTDSL